MRRPPRPVEVLFRWSACLFGSTRGVRLVFVGFPTLLFASCSSERESDLLEDVFARLRECQLMTEGDYYLEQEGEQARCRLKCTAALDECSDLESVFCGGQLRTIESCLQSCFSVSCDGRRIATDQICDEVMDCSSGSDESNCGEDISCENGDLVKARRWCDDYPDCQDGTDESHCSDAPRFLCRNGSDIAASRRCDGRLDCVEIRGPTYIPVHDGSDEVDCGAFNFHDCGEGHYLELSKVCDGKLDCPGGNDEGIHCAVNLCPTR